MNLQEVRFDYRVLEIVLSAIFRDVKENKLELNKMDELLQSKEIELIEYNTKFGTLKKTEAKDEKLGDLSEKLFILQKDNTELIQAKIDLLKNYNELLMKYNSIKDDYRKSEAAIMELRKGTASAKKGKGPIAMTIKDDKIKGGDYFASQRPACLPPP